MPANQSTPTLQQWQTYRRLRAAGCPTEWNFPNEKCFPLDVRQEPAALGTELLPILGGTAVIGRISILASVAFKLTGISVEANWAQAPMLWPTYCDRHHRHCYHDCCGGDVRLFPGGTLRHLCGRTLQRGQEVNGYFAFALGNTVPKSTGQKLDASLILSDELGRSYPYSLTLDNGQSITANGDEYCLFVSAAQIQGEVELRAAEQRGLEASRTAARDPNFGPIIDKLLARRFPPKPATIRQLAQVERPPW